MLRGEQGVLGAPERILHLRGVAEDEEVRGEPLLLRRVGGGPRQLLDLVIEVLRPLAGVRPAHGGLLHLPPECGDLPVQPAHLRRLRRGSREIVHRRQRGRPRQQLRDAVLPHQLHEQRGQLREGGLRDHPAVEVCPAAPRGGNHPPENQLFLPGETRLRPRLFEVRAPREIEARGDLRFRRPRLHGHRVRPLPQREADRLHENRLARPRLPRHDVQPRGERHAHVAEDGEIVNGELDQHFGREINALPT
jgi:hypothetical protein